jgi:hypothetical protein
MLISLTPTSRAVFTIAAQVSSGKGMPFWVRSALVFHSGSPGISTGSAPTTGLVARMKSTWRETSASNTWEVSTTSGSTWNANMPLAKRRPLEVAPVPVSAPFGSFCRSG